MVICFSGAHGTGKSTLATAVAEGCGLPYYPSRAADVHRAYGVTASQHLPFGQRFDIQADILSTWMNDYTTAAVSGGGVFDRTPADMLAYLLADIHRGSTVQKELVEHYREACIVALQWVDHLLLVDPLPHNLADRGADKPNADNIGFMWHHHYLVTGILAQSHSGYLRIGAGPIDQRVAEVTYYMDQVFARETAERLNERQGNDLEQETGVH